MGFIIDVDRSKTDDYIPAKELRVGDELHLTFMGGDEYVSVNEVLEIDDKVRFKARFYADIEDTVPSDKMIWVKKR